MEYLTKQQIILLALFVSFFSSIATGIVTVSLMGQNAPTISQTINRVVERTIERTSPSSPIKETIIVKDDQATINAIAKVSKAVVRIFSNRFLGVGIIVSDSGSIVAKINSEDLIRGAIFTAYLDGGNNVQLSYVSTDASTGLSLFQAEQSSDPKNFRAYSSVNLANSDSVKLGQTVIFIFASETPAVATGIISSVLQSTTSSPSNAGISRITAIGGFDSGVILANLLGEVIGIKDVANIFIPSNIIKPYATASTLHN